MRRFQGTSSYRVFIILIILTALCLPCFAVLEVRVDSYVDSLVWNTEKGYVGTKLMEFTVYNPSQEQQWLRLATRDDNNQGLLVILPSWSSTGSPVAWHAQGSVIVYDAIGNSWNLHNWPSIKDLGTVGPKESKKYHVWAVIDKSYWGGTDVPPNPLTAGFVGQYPYIAFERVPWIVLTDYVGEIWNGSHIGGLQNGVSIPSLDFQLPSGEKGRVPVFPESGTANGGDNNQIIIDTNVPLVSRWEFGINGLELVNKDVSFEKIATQSRIELANLTAIKRSGSASKLDVDVIFKPEEFYFYQGNNRNSSVFWFHVYVENQEITGTHCSYAWEQNPTQIGVEYVKSLSIAYEKMEPSCPVKTLSALPAGKYQANISVEFKTRN